MRSIPRYFFLIVVCNSILAISAIQAQTFSKFLSTVSAAADSVSKAETITAFLSSHQKPFPEDSTVWFCYRGSGQNVAVAGDFNEWNPAAAAMKRVDQTDFFWIAQQLPAAGRVEYKLVVDGNWILDPLNSRTSMGGYGPNSDLWMPAYIPLDYSNAEDIPAGKLDTMWIVSKHLGRRHPVIVYTPAGTKAMKGAQSLWVTDGSDYIRLSEITRIMDILIFSRKVKPVYGIFVDPRVVFDQDSTNKRMTEYSANPHYIDFLQFEVQPVVAKRYGISKRASDKVIMGASMGGLISTYALLTRPEMFAKCASQSPAYRQGDSAVFTLARNTRLRKDLQFYIDTGTIHDTQDDARPVQALLKERGFNVEYAEYPEGHNWKNWRSRIPRILTKFFGMKK